MGQIPNYTTRVFTIPANGSVELYREAAFLTCLASDGAFKVRVDNGSTFEFEAGLSVSFDQVVTRFELENTTGTDVSVTLAIGKGNIRDARLTLTGTIATQEAIATNFVTPSPVSIPATSVIEAVGSVAKRYEAGFKNLGTTRIWIKSNNATDRKGHALDPGETLVIATSDQVFAYNEGGTASELSKWELRE